MFTLFLFIITGIGLRLVYLWNLNKKYGLQVSLLYTGKRQILEDYFPYFRNLSVMDQDEFLKRVSYIMNRKIFDSKDGMEVSNSMKTIISGSLVQLTFGMERYELPEYKIIKVYPDAYLNHRTNKYYKGETNTLGYISLSWKHFIDGYKVPDDKNNVGLHEMSHALLNTIIFSELHDENLDNKLILLDRIPDSERNNLFDGNHPFFRDYALVNIKEFFAVAIECYFEATQAFHDQFPVFYQLMCNLLNQDPINKKYRLK